MGGEVRAVQYAEGYSSSTLPDSIFFQATQLRPFADATAFLTAKGAAVERTDIFENTTTGTIDYYNGSVWVQLLNVSAIQTITGQKTFSGLTIFSNTTQSTDKDTGAVVLEGGLGVEKNVNIGGNLVVTGDFQVNGTTTYVNTTNMDIKDANIILNKGGNQVAADDIAGITVEMSDATHVKIIYDKDATSKWKIGESGSEVEVLTISHIQVVTNKDLNANSVLFIDNADNTKKAKFDLSGITTGTTRTYGLPNANTTFLGNDTIQAVTNKDIDTGTASNTSRITVGKDTLTNLTSLTRKQATIVYDTTNNQFLGDNGSSLQALGGGGGGGSGIALVFRNDGEFTAVESTRYRQLAYEFSAGGTQVISTAFKLPSAFTAGQTITLRLKFASPTGSGTMLIQSTATLINSSSSSLADTTNQYTSTNSAVTITAANKEFTVDLDLTDGSGEINSTALAANDTIIIDITRSTDTNTDIVYFMPTIYELIFS